MKRIAIFQNDLGVGGIQKSLTNLLRNIDYDKLDVDLFLSVKDDFWKADFPEKLNIHYLEPTPRSFSFLPFDLARKLKRYDFSAYGEYDLAVDFNSYQFSCANGATTIPAKYRVMWIHNDVEIKLGNEWKYRTLWHFFKGKFRYYDEFIGVSKALIEPFKKMSGAAGKSFGVIQNFIDVDEIRRKAEMKPEGFSIDENCMNFLALGRLCHQKGYDIMMDTFAQACKKRDDLRLYVIGDGPDREAIEEQICSLGLDGKVKLLGNQSNPFCYMNLMDAFLSTSRYEGQPLNIMEAMAVGLPLYCSKNLEKYTEGLEGIENLPEALAEARKVPKKPDDLKKYNREILESIEKLAEKGN